MINKKLKQSSVWKHEAGEKEEYEEKSELYAHDHYMSVSNKCTVLINMITGENKDKRRKISEQETQSSKESKCM